VRPQCFVLNAKVYQTNDHHIFICLSYKLATNGGHSTSYATHHLLDALRKQKHTIVFLAINNKHDNSLVRAAHTYWSLTYVRIDELMNVVMLQQLSQRITNKIICDTVDENRRLTPQRSLPT